MKNDRILAETPPIKNRMISIRVDRLGQDLKRQFRHLSKQEIDKATSNAINRTLLKGRTIARTAVKKVYNIPQKNLAGIGISRSKPSFLQGHIFASTKPIPMDAFNPRFDYRSASGSTSVLSVSKKGASVIRQIKSKRKNVGVSIEVKKGERQVVPFAFMIPGAKPRVFARGEYRAGNGSYGFVQRHIRKENNSGNDAVKPLISVTIFGAVINPTVKGNLETLVRNEYEGIFHKALIFQANKR